MTRRPESIRDYTLIEAGRTWRVISLLLLAGYVAGIAYYLASWPLDLVGGILFGSGGFGLLVALLYAWTWNIVIGPRGVRRTFLGIERFTPADRIAGFRFSIISGEDYETRVCEIVDVNGKTVASFSDSLLDFDRHAELIRRHYRNVGS